MTALLHPLSIQAPSCPPALLARARSYARRAGPKRLVIAGAAAPQVLSAIRDGVGAGLISPIFIADPQELKRCAAKLEWALPAAEIIPAAHEIEAAEQAVAAIREGRADLLMKGTIHTDILMKAVLDRKYGIRRDPRLVHVFYMSPPDHSRALLIGDAALNVQPDGATRKILIRVIRDIAHSIGIACPKIALLSATEQVTSAIPSTVEARDLSIWAAQALPDAIVGGPYALDLILSREAAQDKGLGEDRIAGDADGIVVPDIISGNALFKSMVYIGGYCAAGLILGAHAPIILTSRADPPSARLAALALALNIECHHNEAMS